MKLLLEVIVESKLLFFSFLLFLVTAGSGRREPATELAVVPGTVPFP